jgi:hypothetical protein
MAENEPTQPGEADSQPQPDQPQQSDQPKIIVDDDWKTQAQAEKQKLAAEAEAEAEGAEGAQPAGAGGQRELPPASFVTLISSIVTQAFMSLGGVEDPRTKKRYVDLDVAKHHIDTLVVLEEKTKGNLTDDEKQMLDQGLYECRMQYVNIAQRVAGMPGAGPIG